MKQFWLILALTLPVVLNAADYRPADYLGKKYWKPADTPNQGELSVTFPTAETPSFLDYGTSGSGPIAGNFRQHDAGMDLLPDIVHESCALRINAGFQTVKMSVTLSHLNNGATFGVLLQSGDTEYLAELTHTKEDWQIQWRVRTNYRFALIRDSRKAVTPTADDVQLSVAIEAESLALVVADTTTRVDLESSGDSWRTTFAATSAKATIKCFQMAGTLSDSWLSHAHDNFQARRIIERLRDYASRGFLPEFLNEELATRETDLSALSDDQRRSFNKASLFDQPMDRATALAQLAEKFETNPTLQYRSGIAYLQSGAAAEALGYLKNATNLSKSTLTTIALAEAYRRVSDASTASSTLKKIDVSERSSAVRNQTSLIHARLLADQGKWKESAKAFTALEQSAPNHPMIHSLSQSVREIAAPNLPEVKEVKAPFGLSVLSDTDNNELHLILESLTPYVRRMKTILPSIPTSIEGSILIYLAPSDYLRACLMPAGERLDNVSGMFMPHGLNGKPSVIACRAFGRDSLVRTLVHELWHLALNATKHANIVPAWMNEGMAVYLSALRFENGQPIANQLPSEFTHDIDSVTLGHLKSSLSLSQAEFYSSTTIRQNYLCAWASVWYCMTESDLRKLLFSALDGDKQSAAKLASGLPARTRDMHREFKKVQRK